MVEENSRSDSAGDLNICKQTECKIFHSTLFYGLGNDNLQHIFSVRANNT